MTISFKFNLHQCTWDQSKKDIFKGCDRNKVIFWITYGIKLIFIINFLLEFLPPEKGCPEQEYTTQVPKRAKKMFFHVQEPKLICLHTNKGCFYERKKTKFWALRDRFRASAGHICSTGRMLCFLALWFRHMNSLYKQIPKNLNRGAGRFLIHWPVVNFTNFLRAAFRRISSSEKIQNQTSSAKKLQV